MAEAQQDAQRTAIASSFFYFLGDVLQGADNSVVPDRGWQRTDGLMGPRNDSAGQVLGADGRYYPRGSSANPQAAQAATQPAAAFVVTPGMLMLAGLAFLLLRK